MTEPLSAATGPVRQRRPIRAFGAAANRLRSRWPATDQLAAPTTQPTSTVRGEVDPPPTAEPLQLPAKSASPVSVGVTAADRAQPDLAQERLATFAERMASVNASFTNPSTGETSVDGPLLTIDAHELNPDTDTHGQRQRPSAPRLR